MRPRTNKKTEELKKLLSGNQLTAKNVLALVGQGADANTLDGNGDSLLARLALMNNGGQFSTTIEKLEKTYYAKFIPAHLNAKYFIDSTQLQVTSTNLGKGATASVTQGRWNNTEVAIKDVIRNENFGLLLQNHYSEIKFMCELTEANAPNVIRFIGYDSVRYRIVMEHATYRSLDLCILNGPILDWGLRYDIFKKITYGLAFIHSSGILHRDTKSANVFIMKDYQAKIGDFGDAARKESTCNHLVGTPDYMAPEIFADLNYSEKSDTYSAGIILRELGMWQKMSDMRPSHIQTKDDLHQYRLTEKETSYPPECPVKFKLFDKWCTAIKPANRPTDQALRTEVDTDMNTVSPTLSLIC
jgi:serine/threonine protein kinase